MLIADPADPTELKELQFNGSAYAPDKAGYDALVKDVMAQTDNVSIEIVSDDSLAAGEVMKVMSGLTSGGVTEIGITTEDAPAVDSE